MNPKDIRIFEDEIRKIMNGQWRIFQVRHSKACPVVIVDGATALGGGDFLQVGTHIPAPAPRRAKRIGDPAFAKNAGLGGFRNQRNHEAGVVDAKTSRVGSIPARFGT
ncbi:MAG: hypothetical protein JW748_06615 [Anaerolineales bacterium]|nr:hypothetical protein [Anaerolineales bacterium]